MVFGLNLASRCVSLNPDKTESYELAEGEKCRIISRNWILIYFLKKQRLGHPWPPFLIGHHLLELSGGPSFSLGPPSLPRSPWVCQFCRLTQLLFQVTCLDPRAFGFAAPCCTWDAGFSLSWVRDPLDILMYIKDLSRETHLALETLA